MPLTITNNSTVPIRYLEWGLESRWVPTTGTPPPLLIDSDSLTPSAAATTGTRTGAFDPGAVAPSVIRATLGTQPLVVCTTGDLAHVGSYRVRARIWAVSATIDNVMVRLSHQAGDGPMRPGRWASPPVVNNWADVDLGLVWIPPAGAGTQRWTGRIEAYSTTAGDSIDVDVLSLIPAEGYGIARAVYVYAPGAMTGRDEFASMSAGAVLNARVAPLGGTWATAGAATDFTAADGPAAGDETMSRATASDAFPGRTAILGATSYTDAEASVDFFSTPDTGSPRHQAIVRYTDASNYLRAEVSASNQELLLWQRVAGAETLLAVTKVPNVRLAWHTVRIVAYASGQCYAQLLKGGALLAEIAGNSTALATGGALASGRSGFGDYNPGGAMSRFYDRLHAAIPAPEPVVIHPGKSIAITSDATRRQDATGAFWGNPPSYVGGRFGVPPAGGPGRKTRICVRARRNDIVTGADDNIGDSVTVEARIVPRLLAVPRQ